MALFDIGATYLVSLEEQFKDQHAFHISKPLVRIEPPARLHRHEFFECFWIASGCCTHFINGTSETLATGQLIFIRPDDTHAFQNVEGPPCRMINIAFGADTAEHLHSRYNGDLANRFFWSRENMPAAFTLDRDQLDELEKMEKELDAGSRSLVRIETFLLRLMTWLLAGDNHMPSAAPPWLTQACDAMRNPALLAKGVPALITCSGRSHEHVARSFRRIFGVTPSSYVNGLRMEWAARELIAGQESITQIALKCGVDDLSHFYRLFRQTYGTSPSRYRHRHQVDLVHPGRDDG